MTAPPNKVLIIGAGLGGTALAINLAQRSIPCVLFELRPSRGTIGGAVALAPNALRVLDRLGVYQTIKDQGFNFEKMRFVNEHGHVIGDYQNGGEQFAYPALRIKRELLLKALQERAQALGVEIRFGKKCVSVTEDEGGAEVGFEDGTTEKGEFVVGFDGLHSLVRPHVAPGIQAHYTGFTGIGFAAPLSSITFPPSHASSYTLPCMLVGQKGNFGLMPDNKEGTNVGCFSTCEMERDLGREGWAEFARDKAIPWVQEVHKDWKDPVKSMLQSLDPAQVHIWPTYELPPLPRWHTARVALCGDAVHAMSPHAGQGAAMALEDSALLARALSLISPSFPLSQALESWEKKRKERFAVVLEFTHRSSATRRKMSWVGELVKEWGMWAFFALKGASAAGTLNGYDVEEVDLMAE